MAREIASKVLLERRDEGGLMHRSLALMSDGSLVLSGHDLGQGVEDFFGFGEYEFVRTYSPADTARIRELLDGPTDLLGALAERFQHSHAIEAFAKEHGMEGEFWSRVGD